MLRYKAVAVLAAISALVPLFYLSQWTHLDDDQNKMTSSSKPRTYRLPTEEALNQTSSSLPRKQLIGGNISDNNARISALNTQAFVRFCHSDKDVKHDHGNGDGDDDGGDDNFDSYNEWIEYIKSSGNKGEQTSERDERRPRFLERPWRNWIINLTAMAEPCDRHVHTSAHCLEFLAREHEYLIPSPAAAPSLIDENSVNSSSITMDFHIFWRGPITDKLSLSAHAFLFTQPLDRARLHLWIDSTALPNGLPEDYFKNNFAAPLVTEPLNRFVIIHHWDQAEELAYAYGGGQPQRQRIEQPLKELGVTLSFSSRSVQPVALSDEARFLILNRHGGIYLDADVMLQKDMSPFYDAGVEFAYEWSNTEMYNTAVLRLFPGSLVARRVLDGAKLREAEIFEEKLKMLLEQMIEGEEGDIDVEGDGEDQEGLKPGKEGYRGGGKKEKKVYNKKVRVLDASTTSRNRGRKLKTPRGMRPDEVYHPARLRSYLRPDKKMEGNGLTMMPTAFFDPLWLRVDHAEATGSSDLEKMVQDLHSFPDAFSAIEAVCPAQVNSEDDFPAGPEVFFTGAYAYHWHNNWLASIEPRSWMGLMRKAYDDFVTGQRPNLYGEYFSDYL
ncbi:hypothetical protein BGZ65_006332 [Modicella reniformis]|uniref:Glycosyltransferase family 32 protein n=1 Tax=Modicella reniformis TaxID=1440133 RepID=A0A9P6J583_9FUNG|nr:hypothetical protein BGZ65_006332 [Modicella reniformis]